MGDSPELDTKIEFLSGSHPQVSKVVLCTPPKAISLRRPNQVYLPVSRDPGYLVTLVCKSRCGEVEVWFPGLLVSAVTN